MSFIPSLSRLALGAAVLLCAAAAPLAQAASAYGTVVSGNTTGAASSRFVGRPDDTFWGLGSADVTYDFGANVVLNRDGGLDLNVYEYDSAGSAEFSVMDVLVSQDGVNFVSLKASETALVRIAGDNVSHTINGFGRSYDLGGLAWARYVRIDGIDNTPPSSFNGFDLDAIGAHSVGPVPVPEPGSWALMACGLGLLPLLRKPARD